MAVPPLSERVAQGYLARPKSRRRLLINAAEATAMSAIFAACGGGNKSADKSVALSFGTQIPGDYSQAVFPTLPQVNFEVGDNASGASHREIFGNPARQRMNVDTVRQLVAAKSGESSLTPEQRALATLRSTRIVTRRDGSVVLTGVQLDQDHYAVPQEVFRRSDSYDTNDSYEITQRAIYLYNPWSADKLVIKGMQCIVSNQSDYAILYAPLPEGSQSQAGSIPQLATAFPAVGEEVWGYSLFLPSNFIVPNRHVPLNFGTDVTVQKGSVKSPDFSFLPGHAVIDVAEASLTATEIWIDKQGRMIGAGAGNFYDPSDGSTFEGVGVTPITELQTLLNTGQTFVLPR